jgi:hypothetical protein
MCGRMKKKMRERESERGECRMWVRMGAGVSMGVGGW